MPSEGKTATMTSMGRGGKWLIPDADYDKFLDLMNDNKFCCALCSNFFQAHKSWHSVLWTGGKIVFVRNSMQVPFSFEPEELSKNRDEQCAFVCLSALAPCFLAMRSFGFSKSNLKLLVQSVRSDIYYGYIFNTLAHLIPRT